MLRRVFFVLAIFVFIELSLGIAASPPFLVEEWLFREKLRGTLRVVDLFIPSASVMFNYAEGLVTLGKDNNWTACLAEDARWIDERTIEFKLRKGVTFHNGEKFNAEAVRVNWEEYRRMESPRPNPFNALPDETILEIIDDYTVRFTFREPDALAFSKFLWFPQIAPAFFSKHKLDENNYGYFPEAGPWGDGSTHRSKPTEGLSPGFA